VASLSLTEAVDTTRRNDDMSTTPTRHNNRTGSLVSEELLKEMVEGSKEFPPTAKGSALLIAENRMSYAQQGETVGSYPPPGDPRAFHDAAERAPDEQTMDLFMDKLGARLAFERSGVRLYEGMVAKVQALGTFDGGPTVDDLQHIRSEELAHFMLLRDCIERLGGDPTAMTPSADVQATLSKGAPDVMADPRIGVIESLDALLAAELVDHASWDSLIEIARLAGEPDVADQFESAFQEEEEHLEMVKSWMEASIRQKTTT
jgi:ferritin-like metal-binding protein YciE